jgi:hypothetical protein
MQSTINNVVKLKVLSRNTHPVQTNRNIELNIPYIFVRGVLPQNEYVFNDNGASRN